MRQLLEGLIAELAGVLADVCVDQGMLAQLLGGREHLETVRTLVALLLQTMYILSMPVHVRLTLKLLKDMAK